MFAVRLSSPGINSGVFRRRSIKENVGAMSWLQRLSCQVGEVNYSAADVESDRNQVDPGRGHPAVVTETDEVIQPALPRHQVAEHQRKSPNRNVGQKSDQNEQPNDVPCLEPARSDQQI